MEKDFGSWIANDTNLCFEHKGESWCGLKDDCSQKGLILPLFFELTWPHYMRSIFYFVGLLFSFLGVSIVADIFMCAIEAWDN